MAEIGFYGWGKGRSCGQTRALALSTRQPTARDVMSHTSLEKTVRRWLTDSANDHRHRKEFTLESLEDVRRAYDGSWALCHFLFHDKGHQEAFREYACRMLRGQPCELLSSLDLDADRLDHEFSQFLGKLARPADESVSLMSEPRRLPFATIPSIQLASPRWLGSELDVTLRYRVAQRGETIVPCRNEFLRCIPLVASIRNGAQDGAIV